MAVVVLYDANVLYPSTLRDLLIRIAQAGLVQATESGGAEISQGAARPISRGTAPRVDGG